MKKIVLIITSLFLLFFIPSTAYGQNIFNFKDNIPGMTCGVAGDTTGKDKCCAIQSGFQCDNTAISFGSGLIQYIPVVGKYIVDYKANCQKVADFIEQNNDQACISGESTSTNFSDPNCKCIDPNINNPNVAMIEMCTKYLSFSSSSVNELSRCLSCANNNGMWTGMGCLPLDINRLISSFVLSTGIGIGGLFALLCIIYSAFMMQSSQGNPEKLKKAQEMITSCIMGLMLIIFSVLIMKIIGVNILRIPGFG